MYDLEPRRFKKPNYRLWFILAGIGLVAAAGVLWFLVDGRRPASPQAELDKVRQAVAQHIILPEGEDPVLATIEDKDKVESEFLKQGEKGDRVLIYAKAKKVIIYRPSVDRIVDIGPVSIVPLDGTESE